MTLFWCMLCLLLIINGTLTARFAIAFRKLPIYLKPATSKKKPTLISVVVAIRNEEQNIQSLIDSLSKQDYPLENFEIILADDHSEDTTREIVQKNQLNTENLLLIEAEEKKDGKKAAIDRGIKHAKNELLVFTDADCQHSPNWLNSLDEFYLSNNKPDMIIGLVDLKPVHRLLQHFFRLEFLSLIISGAGAAQINRPIFNNAANLAVRKEALSKGPSLNKSIASGDDVFLLHEFKRRKKSVLVLKSEEHLVISNPPGNIHEFFNQRIRWASKASSYSDHDSISVSWLVFLTNLFLLFGYCVAPILKNYSFLIAAVVIKTCFDLMIFLAGARFFQLKKELLLVPFIEIVYPIYIVFTAIWSKIRPFQWKGRKIIR